LTLKILLHIFKNDHRADATSFVEFMLEALRSAVEKAVTGDPVIRLLDGQRNGGVGLPEQPDPAVPPDGKRADPSRREKTGSGVRWNRK
jgi:hypothetical protein